jgi:hypothetical protein
MSPRLLLAILITLTNPSDSSLRAHHFDPKRKFPLRSTIGWFWRQSGSSVVAIQPAAGNSPSGSTTSYPVQPIEQHSWHFDNVLESRNRGAVGPLAKTLVRVKNWGIQ